MSLRPRLCRLCRESFQPTRRWQRFCSNACRNITWRIQHRWKKPAEALS